MTEGERRMQVLAQCLGRIVAGALLPNVRFLLVVQEEGGAWASSGDSAGWLEMANDWAARSRVPVRRSEAN